MQGIVKEKGIYTLNEINHQPKVLNDTYCLIQKKSTDIKNYLDNVFSVNDVDVILTGAGSSAFVGETLEGLSNDYNGRISRAIATTDILTNPKLHLTNNRRTLLVSFARSGDSPESVAVVNLANSYCKDIYHLIITCNKNGKLAIDVKEENSFVLLLPPSSNDKSLAMTSSFTAMLLAYLLVVKIDDVISEKENVENLCDWVQNILDFKEDISKLANYHFDRAVFLGSGYMLGVARESHLKLQELTDGQVVCKHDSYLGFRHGPKVVVNDTTLLVYLVSNDITINKYEFDLIQQVNETQKIFKQVIISSKEVDIKDVSVDLSISYEKSGDESKNEYLCISHVVFAQLLGYYKSLNLGLDPDKPSVSGKISRVVKGVNIY